MSIPGNAEPGPYSGQQQSIDFCSAIPIKKRRFPVFQPCSPPHEKIYSENLDSKNQEESNVQDGGPSLSEAKDTASLVTSDATRTSLVAVKNEVSPSRLANVDILVSKPVEDNPNFSLGPLDIMKNKKVMLKNENFSEAKVSGSSMVAQASDVKQEIIGGQTEGTLQLSSGTMNVELSLGLKESVDPALGHEQNEAMFSKPDKLDSLSSLALHDENVVLRDKRESAIDSDSNLVSADRSNWDLNTTMDVWEGSTCSDASAHGLVNIGGFNKTDSCHDGKSLLTTASTAHIGSNKGKHITDGHTSSSCKSFTQQCKIDDSLCLRLVMPYVDTCREHSSLSDTYTSGGPNLSLKPVQLPSVNPSRTVKSEPVDDNPKHDCGIVSCSSTNMESSKLCSVKSECAIKHSLETILQSSSSPEKLDERGPIMSEMVQDHKQEACNSKDTAALSVARVMQHQGSSLSSSALPASLSPQTPSLAQLPTCSELTTGGGFSNISDQSFHSKEFQRNNIPDEPTAIPIRQDNNELWPCNVGISNVADQDKFELTRIDEHMVEFCQNDDAAENGEQDMDISDEDSFGSDTETPQSGVCKKEDEEYEDGEIRDPVLHSAKGDPIVEGNDNDILELVKSDSQNLQSSAPSANQSFNASAFKANNVVEESLDEIHDDDACYESHNEVKSFQDNSMKITNEVAEAAADGKRASSVTPDKQLDFSGVVHENIRKEISYDTPTDGSHQFGVEICGEATAEVVKENCSGEDDSTLSKVKACSNGHDGAKDSISAGNKSRVINLSRPSVLAAPFKTKPFSNRSLTSRNGKERYSDFNGEIGPRGNRVHDQTLRNSRPTFMLGKGRNSGLFGSFHGEWDSDSNFASECSYGQSDYRVIRRKHAPSSSGVLHRNCYNVPQDGNSFGGNRRKAMDDEFPSLRHGSLRRLSAGDRDGPAIRGFQMLHRIPRNMSPNCRSVEADSDMIGLRNDDKFMQHLSDDVINPVYGQPQGRGYRNFSSTMQRKGYPRIRSKSPVRSRSRSPGPWSSPQRSQNGLTELAQHRSPALYRMGRIRSPDHACFHDDIAARRRGSPSYVARHNTELRDVESGREHMHPRPADSNRRRSPGRFFPRNNRRADELDSRETGDVNKYANGPSHQNKFHEFRGDGNINNRRKFIERRGPLRSFRPNYNNDNDNFRFHRNEGPRPYRFCSDADTEFAERSNAQEREFVERSNAQEKEFVERNNAQEREFDGRIKHQSLAVSQRIRNIEEQQQDGNYRPVERVWHDDGFTDGRVKRRRF